MLEINKKILEYKINNKLDSQSCASKLGIPIDSIKQIENNKDVEFTLEEQEKILKNIERTYKSRKVIKIMDLIFRLVSMIMAMVTLLLCINENVNPKSLIVLLSIGMVCSTMTILPKIEK